MPEPARYVIALDPGKRTGIAQYDMHRDQHDAWDDTEDTAMSYLGEVVMAEPLFAVICETIIISAYTKDKGQDVLPSIRQWGVARHLCRWYAVPFVEQRPSDRKFGEAMLEHLGWYTKGSDHARSASGHLVTFLANTDPEFRKRLVGS